MDLEITETESSSECTVIGLEGRINGLSAPRLKHYLHDLVARGKTRLILDMKDVSFIDSSGLSALISGLKYTREAKGFLRIADLKEQAATVIKLMMLDRVLDIYDSVEKARTQDSINP